jgi:transcriptional regulator NrdR family protein
MLESFPLAFSSPECQYIDMVCIYCGGVTNVVNSRQQIRTNNIWRRRKCSACDNVFTTSETADLAGGIRFNDRNDSLTPFNRDQLFISLYESCKHRPTAIRDASNMAQQVVTQLLKAQTTPGVLTRAEVVKACIRVLKTFDSAAATFYVVYHPL